MFCIECGQEVAQGSEFCVECGAKISIEDIPAEGESFCIECGEKLPLDAGFCPSCGAAKTTEDTTEGTKEKTEEKTEEKKEAIPIPDHDDEPLNVTPPPPSTTSRKPVIVLTGITVALLVVVVGLIVFIMIDRADPVNDNNNWTPQLGQHDPSPESMITDEEYFIWRVTSGYLDNHPDVLLGPALESAFASFEWIHFRDENENIDRVSIHGNMLLDDDGIMTQLIFQFTADGSSFAPINLIIGGEWQDVVVMHDLLNRILNS